VCSLHFAWHITLACQPSGANFVGPNANEQLPNTWIFEKETRKEEWQQGEEYRFEPPKNKKGVMVKMCPKCGTSNFFPSFFNHCPKDGSQLKDYPRSNVNWTPPYGASDGSRSLKDVTWQPKETSNQIHLQDFPLPDGGGRFAFFVTNNGNRLLSLDRENSKLSWFCPIDKTWNLAMYVDSCNMDPWSWAAVQTEHCIAFPSHEGICIVYISQLNDDLKFEQFHHSEAYSDIRGGVAVLNDNIYIPLQIGGVVKILHLDVSSVQHQRKQVLLTTNGCSTKNSFRNPIYFAAPIYNGRNDIFWIAEHGFVAVRDNQCVWHEWPYIITGLTKYSSYRDANSAIWCLCQMENGSYCYHKLTFDGSKEIQQVEGPHLNLGTHCFRKNNHYHTPWDSTDDNTEQWQCGGHFIQPLLELKNIFLYLDMDDMSVSEYMNIDYKAINVKYNAHLKMHDWNKRGEDFDLVKALCISSPWDVKVFLFDNSLYVYIESQNICQCISGNGN
jgi:hypothetical protein